MTATKTPEVKPEQNLAVLPQSSIVPQTFRELNELAGIISKTDMVPTAYKNKPGDCLVAMMMGYELGIPYLMALQNIATINGKPSIYGDLGLALVRATGELELFDEYDQGEALKQQMGKCIIRRRGDKKDATFTFSVEDAKTAGLWKKTGPWSNYPGRMLQMRARAFALRDKFTDTLKGLGIAEEVGDYIETTAERVVQPAATPLPAAAAETVERGSQADKGPAQPAASIPPEPATAAAPQAPTTYLIDKVTKSAHAGLFYIFINGVRYNCSDEEVAKGAYDLCENNKKAEKPRRVEFQSEIRDNTPTLISYAVETAWPK